MKINIRQELIERMVSLMNSGDRIDVAFRWAAFPCGSRPFLDKQIQKYQDKITKAEYQSIKKDAKAAYEHQK